MWVSITNKRVEYSSTKNICFSFLDNWHVRFSYLIEDDSWVIKQRLLKIFKQIFNYILYHAMVMSINITPIGYVHPLYNKGTSVIKFNKKNLN